MIEIVYAISPSSDEISHFEYESFSGAVGYMFPILRNLSPYVSLGYSASKFTAFNNNYGFTVDSSNGKLESITLEGNVKGILMSFGVLYNITQNIGINIFGNYKFYPDVKVNSQSYSQNQKYPTVDAKGFEFGLSINFTN
jgi:outer membrane protein W